MTDITKDLEALGLRVNKVADNVYLCRTPNEHLLVCYYGYDEYINDNAWSLETPHNNTVNVYLKAEWLLEALKNYLGLGGKK